MIRAALLFGVAMLCTRSSAAAPQDSSNATSQAKALSRDQQHKALDAVLARATAVSSGRFELIRSTGFRLDANSRTPRGPYLFSLSDDDWARHAVNEPKNVIVNTDGQRMSLYPHPRKDDGTRDYGAKLQRPVDIRKVERDTSPFFAGTFWYQLTLDFAASRKDKARYAGSEVIDGIETHVFEWEIKPKETFDVLPSANGVTFRGGHLRVFAAPSLGYALPRIDIVNSKGVIGCQFISMDFEKVAEGIWFPKKSCQQWFDPLPAFYEEYEFSGVSLVNDEIPEEDFEFKVPAKTVVSDERDPATSALITVDSPKSQSELEELLAGAKRYGTRPR